MIMEAGIFWWWIHRGITPNTLLRKVRCRGTASPEPLPTALAVGLARMLANTLRLSWFYLISRKATTYKSYKSYVFK